MSDNTNDMIADPQAPTNQESRTAMENYADRKRDRAHLAPHKTVMTCDYMPVSINSY